MNSWAKTKLPGGLFVTSGKAVIIKSLPNERTGRYRQQPRPVDSLVLTLPAARNA
ncbi:hypothetical protein CROQUDRAFT_95318 [Cronartium quercuum f. sp. fusiforme G11]|uniref:Uncharacterized protein n=1 Tax=Cronartium quercuum f. sp. fusiforme G11 TaxID=708437 RepID=A0A9P6NHD1_9BASI|nr:hypothetical protein CROQUDRAFT_95318 [Cronartium quercuum f. sp. fusiforme G11]